LFYQRHTKAFLLKATGKMGAADKKHLKNFMAHSNISIITGTFQGQPGKRNVFRNRNSKTIVAKAREAIRSFKYSYAGQPKPLVIKAYVLFNFTLNPAGRRIPSHNCHSKVITPSMPCGKMVMGQCFTPMSILYNTHMNNMTCFKESAFLFLLLFSMSAGTAQTKTVSFAVRLPVQLDFQKTEGGERKGTAVNFGINGIAMFGIGNQLSAFAGIGYFRERFNIKRSYNHGALNPGPSLSILLYTNHYDYHLLTLPTGISYALTNKSPSISLGAEYIPGFKFLSSYPGKKPFPDANTTKSGFSFFSHQVNLSVTIPVTIGSSHRFALQPFVRLLQSYKNDAILDKYSTRNEMNTRMLNAVGISFNYQFK
jgi:hypothetical protein